MVLLSVDCVNSWDQWKTTCRSSHVSSQPPSCPCPLPRQPTRPIPSLRQPTWHQAPRPRRCHQQRPRQSRPDLFAHAPRSVDPGITSKLPLRLSSLVFISLRFTELHVDTHGHASSSTMLSWTLPSRGDGAWC